MTAVADDILDKRELPNAATYQAQSEAAALKAMADHWCAIEELGDRLKQEENNPDVYLRLAKHYEKLGEFNVAVTVLEEGLTHCPPIADLYRQTINALEDANRVEEARRVARRAAEVLPDERLLFRLKEALLLPVLYATPEEVTYYHNKFVAGMKELLAGLKLDAPTARRQALTAIGDHSNFYLPYQPGNLRSLQEQYGDFVHRIMAANYPQWAVPLKMPPVPLGGKLRIGYISSHFRRHSDQKCFLGWLSERSRDEFEIFAFQTGRSVDLGTDDVRRVSDHFYHIPRDLERSCEAVLRANLHVLVFINLLNPAMMQLAGLRLAPIQSVAWAQQLTSGLPTMDYYLSGSLLEPEDGEGHYSERLVRLPGLGICYPKPVVLRGLLDKPRSYFGLGEDRTVYLCSQALSKYLPQDDDVLAHIAKRNPTSQFFFPGRRDSPGGGLARRLERAFAAEGLNAADYCIQGCRVLKILDYWNLQFVSDVFLDTFNFSGCITTMESVACGLPVVTCSGELSRGRQSSAILKQLGVTDTIGRNKEEYVNIAVRLGQDKAWRAQIVERMKANQARLYSDTKCVRALEEFYRFAVRERLT